MVYDSALNLESKQTKILYLPLKDESMPNLKAHTTSTCSEHGKLHDIIESVDSEETAIGKEWPRSNGKGKGTAIKEQGDGVQNGRDCDFVSNEQEGVWSLVHSD